METDPQITVSPMGAPTSTIASRLQRVSLSICSKENRSTPGERSLLYMSHSHRMHTYQINTASYFFTAFALLPLLAGAKTVAGFPEPGNIINLSSMSGITVTSQRGQFNYNASKAATLSLSKMLATEFARRELGVRVNCICPGYFPSVSTRPIHRYRSDEVLRA